MKSGYVTEGHFTIEAKHAGEGRIFVASVSLDGRPLAKPFVSHAQLKAGSTLTFEMTDSPTNWGR